MSGKLACSLLLFPFFFPSNSLAQSGLSTYNIDQSIITVSGVSAGAAFATQFHVAYSSVFAMLNHVKGGSLNSPNTHGIQQGQLYDKLFNGNAFDASMDPIGYLYVPPQCEDGALECKLHVFFHGCSIQREEIGHQFIDKSGFVEAADANDMIILFPENLSRTAIGNPFGCFNWFGYLNDLLKEDYATKNAKQMKGVYDMIARVAGI